jgi:hypothetical protein
MPCVFHPNYASTSSYLYSIYYSNTTRCLISREVSCIQNSIKCLITFIHSSNDWICFRPTRLQPLLIHAFPSTKVLRLSRSFVRYNGFGEYYTTFLFLCLAPKLPTVRSGTEGQFQMYLWQEQTVTERAGSQPTAWWEWRYGFHVQYWTRPSSVMLTVVMIMNAIYCTISER